MPSYLVTGANRGLGYGFVQYLAKTPENTIIGIVRDKAAADAAVAKDGLQNVTMIQAEISDRTSLLAARDQVASITGGSLDYLINNAAFIDTRTADGGLDDWETDPELWEQSTLDSFRVNVIGVVSTINVFLPLIKNSNIKKVVLISSGMADPDLVVGGEIFDGAPYTISKAAANMAMYKFHARFKKEGILFISISPGVVATWKDGPSAVIAKLKEANPGFEPLLPIQSAEMVLDVIHKSSVEKGNGGDFVSHFGTKQWL